LERRIAEERDKWDKKLQRANEEYYDKLRQDQLQYEEEIETLKEELREADATYSQAVAQYDHELALKQQTIDTLEKYIAETKLNL
jgi:multidrug resistance efflux pump